MRCIFVLLIAIVVPGHAQQMGDANRNYRINGQGASQASPAPVTVPNCAACGGWSNEYFTTDPGAPLAWITASQGQVGWFTTATNSVDIGPAGLGVILDGTDPNDPLAPAWATDANGDFSLSLSLTPALHGASAYFAMLHFAPTAPDGFWLSQTHQTGFDPANTLAPTQYSPSAVQTYNIGDDESVLVALGFTFNFYGTGYTTCYINSNGSVSFGAPSTSPSGIPVNMASGPPRAAVWWTDLDPSAYGTVGYEDSTWSPLPLNPTARVTWSGVPVKGVGGSNSFSITLRRTNPLLGGSVDYDVIFDYSYHTSLEGLVGISPGGTIFGNPTPTPIDLSAGPNPLSSSQGVFYFEQFSYGSNPVDLYGQRVTFALDNSGFPSMQH